MSSESDGEFVFHNGNEIVCEDVDVSFDKNTMNDYYGTSSVGYVYDTELDEDSLDAVKNGFSISFGRGVEMKKSKDYAITQLQKIAGVGSNKAEILYDSGYETVSDIRDASQSELSEVEGIGNALAARIKADIKTDYFDIDAEELVEELEGEKTSFLEEGTLMVDDHE